MSSHAQPSLAVHLATLRWLLLSAPLLVPPHANAQLAVFTAQVTAHITLWLDGLQADGTAHNPLALWMQSRQEARIGRYAEQLLEFYLLHGPVHRLVAAHVPLRSQVNGLQVTHGELDFLLIDAHGQYLHWELAVKFFLCTSTADTATPADFMGPNGVETLAHKWHKLFAHQLTRAQSHTLPAPWGAQVWQPQAYTRGWMFYRWGHPVPHCHALHSAHGTGWWVDAQACNELPEADYAFLPRLHWMAPLHTLAQLGEQAVVLPRDAMAQHLINVWATTGRQTDALMVVQLDAPRGSELRRFFIRPPRAAGQLLFQQLPQ